MKRIIVSIMVVTFLLCSTGCNKEKGVTEQKVEKNKNTQYKFYHKEYEERYENYKKVNKDLSEKEIIIRVNIGLDKPYYTDTSPSDNLNTIKLLVNKYRYLKEDYVPNNLVELTKEYSKGGIYLVDEAAKAFQELVDNAKKDGLEVRAISAYRSYAYQVNLYNRYKNEDGKAAADTYSARPGFSEHQTGLCVDVDNRVKSFTEFEETKSFDWMQEHAHEYGFILRFPNDKENITGYTYESWHYRYVGKEIATYIKKNNITWDEYYMEFLENEGEK